MSFYWITRLDAICILFEVVFALSIIAGFLCIAFFWAEADFDSVFTPRDEEDMRIRRFWKRCAMSIVTCFFVSLLGIIFVPTTKEMCAIYVVDYLKDNEKVQKMPEQIIDAAASFLEEQAKKEAS